MPWYIVLEFLHIFILVVSVKSIVLNPVHWNSSNPMFKVSNNDHVIEVNMMDQIDFSCPHYPGETGQENAEYYIIYKVPKLSYDNCEIAFPNKNNLMILNCSQPYTTRQRKFTIFITNFSPIPNTPEFNAGESHYFITTSTGKKHGLVNRSQGACYHNNMKLSIKVCCESTTTSNISTSTLLPNTLTSTTLGVGLPGDKVTSPKSSTASTSTPSPSTTPTKTISSTTTSVKWRSSTAHTRKTTVKSAVTTKKQSDNKDSENDTRPKNNPHASGSVSLHTNNSVVLHLQILGLLLSTVFWLSNR